MKVGFAVADITPELGIYLTGYGNPERLAEEVHSPLTATVMALQDEEKTVAVIGFDWCYMDVQLAQELLHGLAEVSGLPEANILLCCSHTHSAPQTAYRRTLGRVSVDPEYKGVAYAQKNIPVIGGAIARARASLRETEAAFAAGKTETGVSRRGTNEAGEVRSFIADPNQIYDSNMTTVLFRDRETHENIGILVHCSAHNTCLGASRHISSDWCGIMRSRIRQTYPVPVLFLNGAFGDVGPRTTNFWVGYAKEYSAGVGGGISAAEEVGSRAATDALRLLEDMRYFISDLPLKVRVSKVVMPQEIPLSEAETREVIRRYEEKLDKNAEPPVEYQVAKAMLKAWGEPPQPELEFEHTLIAFGPLALVPFPFEMFSVFSLRLRKYGPFEYTLLCGNANGCYAYLPDRGAIAVGGYEIACRHWSRPYVTKPEAGDLAVSQTLKALREM